MTSPTAKAASLNSSVRACVCVKRRFIYMSECTCFCVRAHVSGMYESVKWFMRLGRGDDALVGHIIKGEY